MRLSPSNVYKSSRELAENQYQSRRKNRSDSTASSPFRLHELRISCKFMHTFVLTSIRLRFFAGPHSLRLGDNPGAMLKSQRPPLKHGARGRHDQARAARAISR